MVSNAVPTEVAVAQRPRRRVGRRRRVPDRHLSCGDTAELDRLGLPVPGVNGEVDASSAPSVKLRVEMIVNGTVGAVISEACQNLADQDGRIGVWAPAVRRVG